MANIPMKSIKLPGLEDTYTFLQNDATLTLAGKAADAKAAGDKITELRRKALLQSDEIPDTVQNITFDNYGNVSQITHKLRTDQSVTVRTDTFTFGSNTITEIRTLETGESLTIVTDTDTLVTTTTYAEETA